MPRDKSIKKVLVIGSGPIIIGQAAEFDYAGAQACRVLKEEGIDVVLVNSNPATIMTDKHMADEIYLEPMNVETVKRIIEKEKPDSILAGLGGQTGLTIAMELSRDNWLEEHGVRLLGSDINAIDTAEDRELFHDMMEKIGEPVVPSGIAQDVDTALKVAEKIGYPVIVRPAFTLGGTGGGIAADRDELAVIARQGLDQSPITQILVEKCISGWKEIEFETMRDSLGNVIAICSMENFDPVGIHTGDSIVVAPTLTLADREYEMLRSSALKIISSIGIEGGCNCQFALDPESFEYAVIEVNPRVSRSSALASKATGYPIAKITTKIALGYTLDEITNDITGKTCACFEPAIDYVALKLPKWPFDKFAGVSRELGTKMKATGEVMAIGHSFEAALMKAVRGAEIKIDTLEMDQHTDRDIRDRLKDQDDRRLFTIFEALKSGVTVEEIHEITKIDRFFLNKILNLGNFQKELESAAPKGNLPVDIYREAKRLGFTDEAIKRISGAKEVPGMEFSYKMVDTCGAEFDAETPYFYSTTDELCDSRRFKRSGNPVIMVLGSGPIRIGQGIEFDYSSVHCVWTLRELGYEVVIVNNNPETVSTDYDTADRLYFEPLCPEDVMNIIKVENPVGVVVAFGGQTAIKLTQYLDDHGVKILGTSAESIDIAEDRGRFDVLLEKFGISRPKGLSVTSLEGALEAAAQIGYPVLLRPSYVIGGQNMTIAGDEDDVTKYMERILENDASNTVLVDKYMPGIELEVDVISDGSDVLIPGIMEHIEKAGIHSGDSIAVYPPYNLTDRQLRRIVDVSEKLALALGTKGLVNIQYLLYKGELYVIEVNPRASRTVPYISKVAGVPMVDLASQVMLGEKLYDLGYGTGLYRTPPYTAVKVPVFSFEKLTDANSILGPEMKSTGEVLGLGRTLNEALYKGLTAAGFTVPHRKNGEDQGVMISVQKRDYPEILPIAMKLDGLGMKIYATRGTAEAIRNAGIDVTTVKKAQVNNDIIDLIESGKTSYIIFTGTENDASLGDYTAVHKRAMQLGVPCLTSVDTARALVNMIASGFTAGNTELVDINHMRASHRNIRFTKLNSCGDDYIVIKNFDGRIEGPESLCVSLCDRRRSVGGNGIVLIEKSRVADVKIRVFNRDGSEGGTFDNGIRCGAKYIYEEGFVGRDRVTVETVDGVRNLRLFLRDGRVNSVSIEGAEPVFDAAAVPVITRKPKLVDSLISIGGREYRATCLRVGNPHCVLFLDQIDNLDIEKIGTEFEYSEAFPQKINTEFVRIVDRRTMRMRVWERANGETLSCGSSAIAAVAAAVELGYCDGDKDIFVEFPGGDMVVSCQDGKYTLNGEVMFSFEGKFEY